MKTQGKKKKKNYPPNKRKHHQLCIKKGKNKEKTKNKM